MCGICGIYHTDGAPARSDTVAAMKRMLVHRGPDQDGTHVEGPVGLGHRRLSIIGVADGRQPLSNEDDSIWVTFNGEIYNHHELRDELTARGHTFRTHTDTEVLVHLYEEEGAALVRRLDGMFAFAIWDQRSRRMLLARDRLGKKPLYWAQVGERFLFASELKGILAAGGVPREPNREAIHHYLGLGYVPAPLTAFVGIHQLPPGSLLTVDEYGPGGGGRYWEVDFKSSDDAPLEQMMERLDGAFDRAVAARLESEVPLGVFLSGGVDSSAVVERTSRALGRPVISTTIRFAEAAYDESPHARKVAGLLGTEHHEHLVGPGSGDLLERLLWHFDEPFADASAIPTWHLCRAARQEMTVALSGDGGDELFAGYHWYRQVVDDLARRHKVPGPFRKLAPWLLAMLPLYARGRGALAALNAEPGDAMALRRVVFSAREKRTLYGPGLTPFLGPDDGTEEWIAGGMERARAADPVSAAQASDYGGYLADDILVKVDRMSMAHALEVRSPLLDHELVEMVARFPAACKLHQGEGKFLFKKMLEKSLPNDILYRRKQGFSVPLGAWFRDDWKPVAHDLLFDGRLAKRGYFDMNALRDLWHAHEHPSRWRQDLGERIWTIMNLELWHRLYIDSARYLELAAPMGESHRTGEAR